MKTDYQSKTGVLGLFLLGICQFRACFWLNIYHLYRFGALRCTGLARRVHPVLSSFVQIFVIDTWRYRVYYRNRQFQRLGMGNYGDVRKMRG